MVIPPILLEGDQPVTPAPGASPRVASIPPLPAAAAPPGEGVLPESYGTGRLFLTPRDPHCLCAHWDLTAEKVREHVARAAGGHLALKVHLDTPRGERAVEVRVHPESRHWFVQVARPGASYTAELGCYSPDGQWHRIAVSEPIATPGEALPAGEEARRFAEFTLESAPNPPGESRKADPPAGAPPEPRPKAAVPETAPANIARGHSARPAARRKIYPLSPEASGEFLSVAESPPQTSESVPVPPESAPWTAAREEALWEIISGTTRPEGWPGSAEIAELVRRQQRREAPAAEAPESALPVGLPEAAISSPTGGAPAPAKGFWFSVNAELIIYGATEPGAQVSIGGQPVQLRADGTFSYRFALPDGTYSLPVVAVSAHGEIRRADLAFYRGTRYGGAVAPHPPEPGLKPPPGGKIA